jgi:hypothetical protein
MVWARATVFSNSAPAFFYVTAGPGRVKRAYHGQLQTSIASFGDKLPGLFQLLRRSEADRPQHPIERVNDYPEPSRRE